MYKYCFIVFYTENYLPGIKALRTSIKRWCPHIKLLEFKGDSIEGTAIERFNMAAKLAPKYDAICLLDADMFLTADPTLFFEIASRGFIVTGSNGMVINFDKEYQEKYGVDLKSENYLYPKIHTTVPIFINKDNIHWFKELYDSKRIDHWDDFLYLNILGIKMGMDKKMIVMPPYTFTGIHHWIVKPATGVFKKGDILLSGTEEQIYIVHGKWWDKGWLQDLLPTMKKYLKDENIGEKGLWRTEQAIKILKEEFNKLTKKI